LVEVINLRSNNLAGDGTMVFAYVFFFKELNELDLAENKIFRYLSSVYIPTLTRLEVIDISNNVLTGHADVLFPSSTSYVNFSHNHFSGVSLRRFNAAYETMKVLDLSNNEICQDASEIFLNMPPNIEKLVLSRNSIKGKLPEPFPLQHLIIFAIANNHIDGTLPDLSGSAPLLRELDLSNQKGEDRWGLNGTISTEIFKLIDLTVLNLAGNNLSGEIPASIGSLAHLKELNISFNALNKQIPFELGRLIGMLLGIDNISTK
jgi:Leucine-rich repeat (LRR) protein